MLDPSLAVTTLIWVVSSAIGDILLCALMSYDLHMAKVRHVDITNSRSSHHIVSQASSATTNVAHLVQTGTGVHATNTVLQQLLQQTICNGAALAITQVTLLCLYFLVSSTFEDMMLRALPRLYTITVLTAISSPRDALRRVELKAEEEARENERAFGYMRGSDGSREMNVTLDGKCICGGGRFVGSGFGGADRHISTLEQDMPPELETPVSKHHPRWWGTRGESLKRSKYDRATKSMPLGILVTTTSQVRHLVLLVDFVLVSGTTVLSMVDGLRCLV